MSQVTVGAAKGAKGPLLVSRYEVRRVIMASSLGTIFEWYDFYLCAVLAPFFAKLFFPPNNDTAALLGAFATYAAGFIVRPFGAVLFGRLGDRMGRKYTFLISIIFMGFSTFTVGLMPTYDQIGWIAPILLVILRFIQGLALGGEYGGAATYVAEYTEQHRRGYATSWIQTTAQFGLLSALVMIGLCHWQMNDDDFAHWGWRLPFLASIVLLLISIYIRVTLRESPVFIRMMREGRGTRAPLWDSFFRAPNNKYIILAMLGATAGQGVVTYMGQFYTLFFLTLTMGVDYLTACILVGLVLAAVTPFFVFFGWLSDKIGRLKIILAGCLLAALTYIPLFHTLAQAVNPALIQFQTQNPIALKVDTRTCSFYHFIGHWSSGTVCDQVTDYLTKAGLSFKKVNAPGFEGALLSIGNQTREISPNNLPRTKAILENELFKARYPGLVWKTDRNGGPLYTPLGTPLYEFQGANPKQINTPLAALCLFITALYVTMVYGPLAAFLVELFPAKIRYTSMSFPYHMGNGIFGGLLPLLAIAIVAGTGDIYAGLWYPIVISGMTFLVGLVSLRDQRQRQIYN